MTAYGQSTVSQLGRRQARLQTSAVTTTSKKTNKSNKPSLLQGANTSFNEKLSY